MVERIASSYVTTIANSYPIVTVTGPRQSGKTTLCRTLFPKKSYVSFEPYDVRELATIDPRGFLRRFPDGAIFDDVQFVPQLLSYLQVDVDENPSKGRFVLTASQNFARVESITQSLAGRTGLFHVLPLSHDELQKFPDCPETI